MMEVRVPLSKCEQGALRRWHAFKPFEGFLLQCFPVVRVRYVDESVCTLADALAEERGDPLLSDNIVDMAASRDDTRALLDVGADLADPLGGH